MRHTPGPWATVDAEWIMSRRTGMGYRYFPVRGTGQTWDIANVFADEDDPEMVANARLIAAAPELLDACRSLLDSLVNWCDIAEPDDDRADDHKAIAAARKAIAKAEGRE